MELALFVWFASVIGNIKLCLMIILLLCAMYAGTKAAWALSNVESGYIKRHEPDTHAKAVEILKFRWLKGVGTLLALVGFTVAVIPEEKTLYMMAAGYGTQAVVQSETADKVLKIVNGKLDEYITEMEKTVKGEVKK